jgi:hypothetical protein
MLAAIAIGALLAADAAGYQLSAHSETRSGSVAATGIPSPSIDEQVNLLAGISGTSSGMSGDLSYAPSLTYDVRGKSDPEVLHREFATGTYRLARSTTLSFGENLSYGHRDFRPLAPQPQDPTKTLPAVVDPNLAQLGIVPYLQWGTGVGIDQILAPGIVLGVHGSYGASGGADAAAQKALPLQHTASASARLGWVLNRRDSVGFSAGAVRSSFGPGASSTLLSTGLGVDHRFSTATQGTLGAGASFSRDEAGGVTSVAPVRPTAAAGLTHSELVFGRKVVSAALVSVATAIDPFGGRTYSRVEGSLSLAFVPLRDLSFQLRGSGARGLASRPELRNQLWQVEGTSSYTFARGLDMSVGCRTAFADAAATPNLPSTSWSAFVSLGFAYAGRI